MDASNPFHLGGLTPEELHRELRALAAAALSHESPGHTLQTTALAHEVYLRLVTQRNLTGVSREHFFAAAAEITRRVLVDHARTRDREKRGGGKWQRTPWASVAEIAAREETTLLDWADVVERLLQVDPVRGRVAELRIFGGLDMTQIAEVLDVSRQTVHNHWTFARAWLAAQISGGGHA